MPVLRTRHDIERAVDGQRNDRQLQLVGQRKGTLLKHAHVTCERTGTLGKDNHGTVAGLQNMTCCLVGLAHLPHPTLVDHNLVRLTTGIAHTRNLIDLVLHHPLEVTTQKAVNQKDIEGALMV